MRVLTYSVSTAMIVRMLDKHSFERFECVFGFEGALGRFADVVAFQQFLVNQVRDSALQLARRAPAGHIREDSGRQCPVLRR